MTLTARQEQELTEIRELMREFSRTSRELVDRIGEARGSLAPTGPLLGFVHIPKTAGGTATTMLARAYSSAAVRDAGNYFRSPETTVRKAGGPPGGWELWHRGGGRVAAGHVPYGLLRDRLPLDTLYMTFLREPVDRVLSHYYRHMQGRAGSLDEALSDDPPPELSNLATRLLCGSPAPIGELPASAGVDAKENLRRFAFVGIQERFEESIVLLQRMLGLELIPYINQHVSVGGARPAVQEISADDRALIEQRNRLDLELYAFGLDLFEEAVTATDEGLTADAQAVRASSEALNDEVFETTRAWLERDAPSGSMHARTLRAAAKDAGVPMTALKQLVKRLPATHRIFLRSDELERGELSSRPLTAFVHVPRTAGATFSSVFADAYPTDAVRYVGGSPSNDEDTPAVLGREPARWQKWQQRGGRVVCGHVTYEALKQRLPPDTRYVTLLRQPVDRVLSHYYSEGHRPVASADERTKRRQRRKATAASLEEALVELRLPELNNLATRFLAGENSSTQDLPPTALEEAKANLREFALVGLRERFDESVLLLWRLLGREPVPELRTNVTVHRPRVEEIPAEQRALIEEHNRLDLGLYAFACQLLEEAVAQADDGFAAEAESLRAASDEATRNALERARALLERRTPTEGGRRKSEISAVAQDTGLDIETVEHAAELLSANGENGGDGGAVRTRTRARNRGTGRQRG